jgi:hypothetical protein
VLLLFELAISAEPALTRGTVGVGLEDQAFSVFNFSFFTSSRDTALTTREPQLFRRGGIRAARAFRVGISETLEPLRQPGSVNTNGPAAVDNCCPKLTLPNRAMNSPR